MTQTITVTPAEKGSAVVTIAPVDEDGVALTIGQLTLPKWQLMRTDGTVVNTRTFALCSLTALSFVLKIADLAVFGVTDNLIRVLSFQATYDSSAGTGLPLNAECRFKIDRLLGQVDSSS